MSHTVFWTKKATKDLRGIPQKIKDKIIEAASDLATNPFPPGYILLEGSTDFYRIRIGDYRLIYTIEKGELVILVLRVGNRKDVYRK